jgi:hypothetical protein
VAGSSEVSAFKTAWNHAYILPCPTFVFADSIDLELHRARIDCGKRKITYRAPLDALPDGCFIRIADGIYLVWGDCLYRWSCDGYSEKRHRPDRTDVEILTPEPIVHCLSQGYLPKVHGSLMAFST